MKKLFFVTFTLIVLCLVSCKKSYDVSADEGGKICFSLVASLPEFSSTKASGEYVIRLGWNAGDEISVIDVTSNKVLGGTLSAQSSGTTTTFSGVLNGTVSEGGQLLFIYPALGNEYAVDFDNYSVDFSNQLGTMDGAVNPVYGKAVASGTSNSMTVASGQCSFSFLMAFYQLSLANLPKSSKIDEVIVNGVPTLLSLSLSDGELVATPAQTGSVTLSSSSLKTSASGAKIVYVTVPECPQVPSGTRSLIVNVGGTGYKSSFTSVALLSGHSYATVYSAFTQTNPSLSLSATYPQMTSEAAVTLPEGQWAEGDAISVVNLSTKELLQGSLKAQAAGSTATFTGDVQCTKGVKGGDELLILYPAIETTETEFSELVYDLGQQSGESLDTAPYVLAGTMVVKNNLSADVVEMEYLTSTTGVSLNNLLATPVLSRIRPMGAGGEGYDSEGGSWGDDPVPFDYNVTGVKLASVPSKLVISYDSANGYVTTVETGEIALDHGTMISTDSDDIKLYFAYPAPSSQVTFSATATISYKLLVDEVEQPYSVEKTASGAVLPAVAGQYLETSLSF